MIVISEDYFETESCVYKLFYGDRYVIVKAKTLAGSIYLFEKGYASFIAGGGGTGKDKAGEGQKEWDGTNTFYFKFYKYIHDHAGFLFNIEVILETNNCYQLLKREEIELSASFTNKKCFNSNVTAYIPKFRTKINMYGWIPKRSVADFRRFLSR